MWAVDHSEGSIHMFDIPAPSTRPPTISGTGGNPSDIVKGKESILDLV